MGKVRVILIALVVIAAFVACESSSGKFEQSPEARRPEINPVEDEGRETPRRRGFVLDAGANVLHRADCPRVEEIEPSDRVFHETQWPALNEGCTPCEQCEPLK